MSNKARFQARRDTSSAWASVNPVLADGEVGFEKDTKRIRVGNGVSNFLSLPFFSADPGFTAAGTALATAEDAAAQRVALGFTAAGTALATAADAAAQRTALGLHFSSGIITPTTPSVLQPGIPSSANWVEVTLYRLSQSSSGNMIIRPRVAGATVSTGYETVEGIGAASSFGAAAHTDGFEISFGTATRFVSGVLRLTRHGTSNNWLASGMFGRNGEAVMPLVSGDVSLSGPLDGIAILAGAGDFDSGSVCINWGG
jgi:hypothetical protein